MPSISSARATERTCPSCRATGAVYWAVIDAQERVDLLPEPGHGLRASGPCGHVFEIYDPVVVARLFAEVPLLVAIRSAPSATDLAVARDLLNELHGALVDPSEFGHSALFVTHEVLGALIAHRRLGRSVAELCTENIAGGHWAPDALVVTAAGLAEALREFLLYRRAEHDVNRLLQSFDERALRDAIADVESWPSVVEYCEQRAREADGTSEVGVMRTIAEYVLRASRGHSPAALLDWYNSVLDPSISALVRQPLESIQQAFKVGNLDPYQREAAAREAIRLSSASPDRPIERATYYAELAAALYQQDTRKSGKEAAEALRQALLLVGDDDETGLRLDLLENLGVVLVKWAQEDAELQAEGERYLRQVADDRSSIGVDGWAKSFANLAHAVLLRKPLHIGDIELAQALLVQVIERLPVDRDPRTRAQAHHNLALSFMRQAGLQDDAIRSGAALDVRQERERTLQHAVEEYQRALEIARTRTLDLELQQCHHNLGCAYKELAQVTAHGRSGMVADAIRSFRRAVALARGARNDRAAGLALVELATLLWDAEDLEGSRAEAVELARQVNDALVDDSDVLHYASPVLPLLVESQDWPGAADLAERAAAALDLAVLRSDDENRRRELLSRWPTLSRWAAYCLYRANRVDQALAVLEVGRARAVGERVAAVEAALGQLVGIDPRLAEQFQAARHHDVPRSRLAAVLREIRQLPGWERFMLPPDVTDLAAAQPADSPLAYLLASPKGAVVFFVGGGEVSACGISDMDSVHVIDLLLGVHSGRFPFLLAAERGGAHLSRALQRFQQMTLSLGKVMAAELRRRKATAVNLVACGPLGLLPWHELLLEDGKRLGEQYTVSYAPSGAVQQLARRRAERGALPPHTAVVLADPDGSLPAARQEAGAVAGVADVTITALGLDATTVFFRDWAPAASILHIACHGSADWSGQRESELELADGPLGLSEIAKAGLQARVVALMACSSGQYDLAQVPDETVGLPAQFLQAGAAAVLATLWPVDDVWSKRVADEFYRHLGEAQAQVGPGLPAAALRAAIQEVRRRHVRRWAVRWCPEPELSLAAFVVVGA